MLTCRERCRVVSKLSTVMAVESSGTSIISLNTEPLGRRWLEVIDTAGTLSGSLV